MANNNFFLYNRKYFTINNVENLLILNSELFNSEIVQIESVFENSSCVIPLKTTYPGLLIGSGYGHDYKHESESMKNEAFKIGYHFDFTTGMPIIPGSSIKGMLRSCFPQKSVKTKQLTKEFRLNRIGFVKDILKNKLKINCDINIDALEDEIFHGIRDGEPIPIYERDIFFDAVPLSVYNSKGQLLDDDYITPHVKDNMSYEMAMLKNPEPLKFLKVSPEVVYRFEFKLNNSKICREVTAEKKLELFQTILLTLGIGAKTNVGYGQFSEVKINNRIGNSGGERSGVTNNPPDNGKTILDKVTKATDPVANKIKDGSEWEGEIVSKNNNNKFLIVFKVGEEVVTIKKKANSFSNGGVPEIGKKVKIKFKADFTNDSPHFEATIIER